MFLDKALQPLLAEHPQVGLLLERESTYRKPNHKAVSLHDAVAAEDLQRHFLDPLLVVDQLTLVLSEEDLGQLADGRGASSVYQAADQHRLIYVLHDHSVGQELD